MKNILIVGIMAVLLSACQSNEQATQTIIGQWKYDGDAIMAEMQNQEGITDQDIMVVQAAMGLYKTAVFEFKEDGTLNMITDRATQVGKWHLSDDAETLFMNMSGTDQPNGITALSEEKMVLAPSPESGIKYTRILVPVGTTTGTE
ncbi:MAG: hypothetical protein MI974_18680 [Chitinophagales bacterium]|nr:hypothetical protein [Chitinophagales bacterium]